jgi:predicted component of type VI protein secretion system
MSLTVPRPRRSRSSQSLARSVDQVFPSLTTELRQTLGILDGAPRGIAELTIATLGLGSRLTLKGLGIVEFNESDLEATSLKITKLGHEVIAACAQYAPAREEVAAARERAVAEASPVVGEPVEANVSSESAVAAS